MVCRDWQTTLRRASYRGAAFHVEGDSIDTGRRLVVHEFPHKDVPYVEDLGRKANSISVNAYLTGDDIEDQIKRLQQACESGGPAALNLPLDRMQAHCEDCKRDYAKDRQGYVAFALKFWRHGSGPGPFSLLSLARSIEFAAGDIVAAMTSAFVGTFATLGAVGYVRNHAVDMVGGFFSELGAATRSAPLTAGALAPIQLAITQAIEDAQALSTIGSVGDRYSDTGFVAGLEAQLAGDVVPLLTGLFVTIREAMAPAAAAEYLLRFHEWSANAVSPGGAGAAQMLANRDSFERLVRVAAMVQYAVAVTLKEYEDVREARQARADAAEYFDALLLIVKDWPDVWARLAAIRGDVANHLHRTITDMAPILQVEFAARMPALWVSQRLYGTAHRAQELYRRNGVKHAAFMPIEFEALAR